MQGELLFEPQSESAPGLVKRQGVGNPFAYITTIGPEREGEKLTPPLGGARLFLLPELARRIACIGLDYIALRN
jgi:hypothetical protein